MTTQTKYRKYDSESDYYGMGYHKYSAEFGRFLAVDPLFEAMPRHNPYHYSFNSPMFWSDPSGLVPVKEKVKNSEKLQALNLDFDKILGELQELAIENCKQLTARFINKRFKSVVDKLLNMGFQLNQILEMDEELGGYGFSKGTRRLGKDGSQISVDIWVKGSIIFDSEMGADAIKEIIEAYNLTNNLKQIWKGLLNAPNTTYITQRGSVLDKIYEGNLKGYDVSYVAYISEKDAYNGVGTDVIMSLHEDVSSSIKKFRDGDITNKSLHDNIVLLGHESWHAYSAVYGVESFGASSLNKLSLREEQAVNFELIVQNELENLVKSYYPTFKNPLKFIYKDVRNNKVYQVRPGLRFPKRFP